MDKFDFSSDPPFYNPTLVKNLDKIIYRLDLEYKDY